jgi:parallel beta-helix repeat protein
LGAPAAFMSYVRFNDTHDDGQLSQFLERLAAEVRAQTGEKFTIFQDRNDIAWGQNWQQRIDEALDTVTLLLVIITPSLFRSPACQAELQSFLDRERVLNREDLILSVYYISAREMDDPGLREANDMARVLASRQFADWRELRFEPFTSPSVRKAIAQLASRMRDTFWQLPAAQVVSSARRVRAVRSPVASEELISATGQVTAKFEPPTHVVDAFPGRGDFTTIGAAIEHAKPGDRILVRPGVYGESLVVDKPLEVLGDGPVSDIEIRSRGAHAVQFQASIGRVANLTLRQTGGEGDWYGVHIVQGRLDLEGCDISASSLSCVAIRGGADPRLRRNQIHNSQQAGVFVLDGALGTLEDNDITSNGFAGVVIQTGADPALRRNQIHDNKQAGVRVNRSGLGRLEDNDITGNALSGVEILTEGNPTVRGNRIDGNKAIGVFVTDNGLGTLEDNDITGNALSGVAISTGGNATVRGNRINGNGDKGIRIYKDGRGVVENNDLTGNLKGAWFIEDNCKENVTRARNKE